MGEIHRNSSGRDTRSRLGEHGGLLLAGAVGVCLVGFFLHHACVPVETFVWQTTARYTVGASCERRA